jgi:general secretion pathway protein K
MRRRREEGIALISVLWTLVLLAIIAAAVCLETRTSSRIARNTANNAAAREAADAGIQRAILDLTAPPGADIKKLNTDGTVYNWQFANSIVHISAQKELSKVNLNQAPETALAALFASVGVDEGKAQSLADAIADFRDADNLVRPRGAEEAEYRAAGLGWGPKNAPFDAVEELQQVLGMTEEIYERIAPHLTAFSDTDLHGYLLLAPATAYSIRAESEGPNGAAFIREAVVQLGALNQVLAWREGATKGSQVPIKD